MKSSIKRNSLLFTVFITIVVVTSFYLKDRGEKDTLLAIDKSDVFPSFSLQNIQSETVYLDNILEEKKVVWIYFWTTDCEFCRRELRMMSSFYSKYKKNGLEILAINVEEEKELIKEYLNLYPVPFKVLMDSKGSLAQELKVKKFPTSFLIDSTRTVQDLDVGGRTKMKKKLHKRLFDK
ncbi:MAG: TlpA disulfide reductase family protein [Balneolaceae bacterium]|nr:TlpA disulfide reductase family protein [Balneolaceae bacterium]